MDGTRVLGNPGWPSKFYVAFPLRSGAYHLIPNWDAAEESVDLATLADYCGA